MSYQEKKPITSITTGVIVLVAYCIYVLSRLSSGNIPQGDLRFWAVTMLIFIGIDVGASIVIQIVFHILLSMSIAFQERCATLKWMTRKLKGLLRSRSIPRWWKTKCTS